MPLTPIDSGDMGSCPTTMGLKLKALIPDIKAALEKADGPAPYVTYNTDDVKKELGSSAKNSYGYAACLNRILADQLKEQGVFAHVTNGGEGIMFSRVKRRETVVTD